MHVLVVHKQNKAPVGVEPTTFGLQDQRSNQLSYGANATLQLQQSFQNPCTL